MTPSDIAAWLDSRAQTKPVGLDAAMLYKAAATIRTQRDDLKIATEALEPFAKAAGKLDGHWSEDDWRWNNSVLTNVTVGDLRSASKALARIKETK